VICRHFGHCGGCAHQDKTEALYRSLKTETVVAALARHGVKADVSAPAVVAAGTRRRATFKAVKTDSGVQLGFHAAKSHDIVDLRECLVLTPALVRLAAGLRAMLAEILAPGETVELKVADTGTGADVSLRWAHPADAPTLGALARWAGKLNIARIGRHGAVLVELAKPSVTFGHVRVDLPPEAFLQPTEDGEGVLRDVVVAGLAKCKRIVDLFSGCGTFSLPLAEKARVHAVELEGSHLQALATAARQPGLKPVTVEKRNLFKRPLSPEELSVYDGVCLDPPRAGAFEQVKMLAAAKVKRIVYVSCDADSFARDAAVLIGAGWKILRLQAVDQFLWSQRIELAAVFARA
jgi:23S rRNA (uracil1939-C5)-methyltransferase